MPGFPAHADLPSLRIEEGICHQGKCSRNAPDEHGNHVAGIIQWANPALNVGQLHGISMSNFLHQGWSTSGVLYDEVLVLFHRTLDEITPPGGRLPNVRVINFSALPSTLWMATATCSPTPLPARPYGGPFGRARHAVTWCTPNNDPAWQTGIAQSGRTAATWQSWPRVRMC